MQKQINAKPLNLFNMKNFGIISGTTEQRIEQIKGYLGF